MQQNYGIKCKQMANLTTRGTNSILREHLVYENLMPISELFLWLSINNYSPKQSSPKLGLDFYQEQG